MRIAVLFKPATGVGSSNEALNIVRHRPEVFIPVASSSIGGKPGLAEVETLFGHMYYPVADLMAGLRKLDPDGILICTVGDEVYRGLPEMTERWPVAWRFNINPLEFTFDPGMIGHIPHVLGTLSQVDAVVTCSNFVEENLRQLGVENVTTIQTCVNTEECVQAKPTKDLVISLTRLAPVKNLLTGILAMGKVINELPTAEYEIYGHGVMASHVANWIRQMGTERVSYKGFESASQVLPRAKVALQMSISENFSLSALEFLASGIPLVCSDIPGHPKSAVRVNYDSIEETYEAVKKLLTDDNFYEERRKDGLKEVEQYDVRKIVPRWEKLFEKLARLNDFKRKSKEVEK